MRNEEWEWVLRLHDNVDFKLYLQRLALQVEAMEKTLRVILVSPEDIAVHNRTVGSVMGLKAALSLIESLKKEIERDGRPAT